MRIRTKFVFAVLSVVICLISWSSVILAEGQMTLTITGTIYSGQIDTVGYFGPPGGNLGGKPFSATITYAPNDFILEGPEYYDSNTSGALEIALTVGDKSQKLTNQQSPGSAFIQANTCADSHGVDNLIDVDAATDLNNNGFYGNHIAVSYYITPCVNITPATLPPPNNPNPSWESVALYLTSANGKGETVVGFWSILVQVQSPYRKPISSWCTRSHQP
jgi:hypothetical protein